MTKQFQGIWAQLHDHAEYGAEFAKDKLFSAVCNNEVEESEQMYETTI